MNTKKLIELRTRRELSQRALARELNITASHLCRIESGKRAASIKLCKRLTGYFDVSLDWLLEEE